MPGSRPRSSASQASFGFSSSTDAPAADAPLAARMRPRTLDDVIGQDRAVGPGTMLRSAVERGRLPSIILWGPPGCGKTTLARILASESQGDFVALSAVSSGVAELRKTVADAAVARSAGRRTVLFIDEIHRFNKAQQDVILPYVEDGTVTMIGATTENPSFEVVAPLLSRVRVIRLQPLEEPALREITRRALADATRGLGDLGLTIDDAGMDALMQGAQGDARAILTALEIAADHTVAQGRGVIGPESVREALQDRRPYYDKGADFHYDTISAFIKSVRGSDPDAAVYWLARMIEAGEDPLFIIRRMVILAAEDIGLADPAALTLAVSCQQAVHFIGLPEGFLPMTECAIYLAMAPKSNTALTAYTAALEDAKRTSHLPVPLHLRNAPTPLMRQFGYGQGYRYAHSEENHFARGERYLPEETRDHRYYTPGNIGVEGEMARRLAALRGEDAASLDRPPVSPDTVATKSKHQ